MPRLMRKLPKYRRHSSRNVGFVEIAGKRIYLPGEYKSKESLEAYRRTCLEWEAQGRTQLPMMPKNQLTISDLILRYWTFAKQYYLKNGVPTDEQACLKSALRPLKKYYSSTLAVEFRPLALKAVQNHMIEAGLSRGTINKHVCRIRRMFKWAVENELLPVDCWQALRAVSGLQRGRSKAKETKPIQPVDEATVEATLPYLSSTLAAMVQLQLATGMRPQEVCILRPIDLDQSQSPWRYRPSHHKTEHRGRERVVLIGPLGQKILAPFLERSPEAYCFCPWESEQSRRKEQHALRKTPNSYGNSPGTNKKRNPQRPPGQHYSTNSYHKAILRACQKAGIPPWAPNRLRHTFATKVRAAAGIEQVRTLLGHSEIGTSEIYAERDYASAGEVILAVG